MDGYTIVKNTSDNNYYYARLNANKSEFLPTNIKYIDNKYDPNSNNIKYNLPVKSNQILTNTDLIRNSGIYRNLTLSKESQLLKTTKASQ